MNSRATTSCFHFHILMILSLLCLANSSRKPWHEKSCNMYRGSWVHDISYPLYDSSACPFIRKEFDCLMYGRPDHLYLQYRWQPNDCNLPRYNIIRATMFDGQDFLRKMKGKKVMYVGDSLSLNNFQSMVCLLHAAVPDSNITRFSKNSVTTVIFQKGLTTWAKWVDSDVDTNKTTVVFQGFSPSHYNGRDWNEPGVTDCASQREPMSGSARPGGSPLALQIVEEVLSTIKKPVHFLNITALSQLRKDGHPGSYSGVRPMDCTHWCVAGLPDTWNELLYATLLHQK
ncbi:PROTEIN TRICHOME BIREFRINGENCE-LIKE 38 [Salix koriyanagi]|uniref:PROTEIN TRICHOME BIREFRINGENCE-LIKE 38 n=1 Tax=Salix koriyanagi TaxID=2511006 RepID=A0A9Q0PUS2_9ROSI|nr:PROTEIN TRICHOME BIREFRINGENCE-LIKE 38 [Salix koriyanagi]